MDPIRPKTTQKRPQFFEYMLSLYCIKALEAHWKAVNGAEIA
jgi:hypothetical protein